MDVSNNSWIELFSKEISEIENYDEASQLALKYITSAITANFSADDDCSFGYSILLNATSRNHNLRLMNLSVRVLKGSLFTVLWSSFARIDDSYTIFIDNMDNTSGIHAQPVSTLSELLSLSGVDYLNSKVSKTACNWNLMRSIMLGLSCQSVGLLQFAKILGKFLFLAPAYRRYSGLVYPMPLRFM